MANKLVSDVSHKPGRMNTDSDYVLTEAKSTIDVMSKKLENSLSLKDIQPLLNRVEELVSKKEFMSLVEDFNKRVVDCPSSQEIKSSFSALSGKIDSLKDAFITLSQKLDGEDVTNLDVDYESTIKTILT
jgi:hypothetical protein